MMVITGLSVRVLILFCDARALGYEGARLEQLVEQWKVKLDQAKGTRDKNGRRPSPRNVAGLPSPTRGLEVLNDLVRRKQLVLWTILCLRWPTLERHFLEQAADVGNRQASDSRIDQLAQSEAVQAVLDGLGVGAKLDQAAIALLAGLRNAHSATSGVVA